MTAFLLLTNIGTIIFMILQHYWNNKVAKALDVLVETDDIARRRIDNMAGVVLAQQALLAKPQTKAGNWYE